MKALISCVVLYLVVSSGTLSTVATDSKFEIIRNVHRGDDILIPNVLCSKSTDTCSTLNAKKSAACSCYCHTGSSSFYESTWQCIDNKKIRQLQCELLLLFRIIDIVLVARLLCSRSPLFCFCLKSLSFMSSKRKLCIVYGLKI